MSQQGRSKVAVVGAGGSMGNAVSRDLARDYDIVALVGSQERVPERQTDPSLSRRYCELFSRQAVEEAISRLRLHHSIAVIDVIRAILYCLGNQEAYDKDYDIGGPVA